MNPDQLRSLQRSDRIWAASRPFRALLNRTELAIAEALSLCRQPVVSFSGGKDSLVLLHLVWRQKPSIVAFYVDTGGEYPETLQTVDEVAEFLDLDLITLKPEPNIWQMYEQQGYWKDGNFQNVGSFVEELYVKPTQVAGEQLLDPPRDGQFMGLRKEESKVRRIMLSKRGGQFVAKYDGIWHFNPLLDWTAQDIWAYISANALPYNKLYDEWQSPSERNTLRVCTWMAVSTGHLGTVAHLRRYHPELYHKFRRHFPLVAGLT